MYGGLRFLSPLRSRRSLAAVPRRLAFPEGRHHADHRRDSDTWRGQGEAELAWLASQVPEHRPEGCPRVVRFDQCVRRCLGGLDRLAVGLTELWPYGIGLRPRSRQMISSGPGVGPGARSRDGIIDCSSRRRVCAGLQAAPIPADGVRRQPVIQELLKLVPITAVEVQHHVDNRPQIIGVDIAFVE